MKKHTVYKTYCIPTGEFYYGKHYTDNPNDSYIGSGSLLHTRIKEFGRDSFIKVVLYIFESDIQSSEVELALINKYIDNPLCMNLSVQSGKTQANAIFSKIHRERLSAAISGTTIKEEHKLSLSIAQKKRFENVEERKKISMKLKGKPQQKKYCPHCDRYIGASNFSRWHGDKCKMKTKNL